MDRLPIRPLALLGQRLLLLVFGGALLACTPAPAPISQSGEHPALAGHAPKHLVAAIRGAPPLLNYALNRTGAGGIPGIAELDMVLNPGMAAPDEHGQLQPRLAQAVPTIENGRWQVLPDGRMETTWIIADGANWHDDAPFTSHDLVFTATVQQDRDLAFFRDPVYDAIEGLTAPDNRTLIVRWRRPYIDADALFSSKVAEPIPSHILEPSYQAEKSRLQALPYWTGEYVGTGPFRLRDWVSGSHVSLEANERYVLGRPPIDTLEVRFIADPNALLATILSGEVELTFGRGIAPEQALEARARWSTGAVDFTAGGWQAMYPQFLNPNPSVQTDVRFRRALISGIDRQRLVDTLVPGLTSVAHTVLPPTDRAYPFIASKIVRYDYDPRAAEQLLTELGYARAADGGWRAGAGEPLKVESRASTDNPLYEKLVLAVAGDWQQLGIGVDVVIFPRQQVNDLEWRQTRPAFELMTQPAENQRFNGAGTPLPENGFRGDNRSRYRNAELDALIDRYFLTIPWDERMEALGEAVHHLSDQVIAIGLVYDPQPMLIGNRVLHASAAAQTANAHEWDLRP